MTFSIHVVGWTLMHFVWQGALVGLAAAVALRLLRSASAQTRYAVACGALAAMLAASVVTARLLSVADRAGAPIDALLSVAAHDSMPHVPVLLATASPSRYGVSIQAARVGLDAVLPLVVSAWFTVVALLLLRLAGGWWRVQRLHLDARMLASSRWQAVSDRIASRLGVHRRVHVVDSPRVDTPTVLGWLRPIVLLPIAALANLAPSQVEAILAHELAHIRRHDYLVNLLQTLAETLLFYHAAVWWVSSRIRTEREHCCDDVSVSVCGDAVGYASALAELETRRMGERSAIALAATDGSLLERVRRVLQEPAGDKRPSSSAAMTIAIVLLLIMVPGGLRCLPAWQSGSPSGRSQTASNLTFEVASIKINKSGDIRSQIRTEPGGRITVTNNTLRNLVRNAYRLQDFQIQGGPDWFNSDHFDIAAKADANASREQIEQMLRTLLADRFKLGVHNETRQLPIYALVMARSDARFGPQLHQSAVDCAAVLAAYARGNAPPAPPPQPGEVPSCSMRTGQGTIAARAATITQLANALSMLVNRVVVDRTTLGGAFDLDLLWTPDQTPSQSPAGATLGALPPTDGPSVFTALQEQLGLKLESTTGPVEVVVIDHVERPTED